MQPRREECISRRGGDPKAPGSPPQRGETKALAPPAPPVPPAAGRLPPQSAGLAAKMLPARGSVIGQLLGVASFEDAQDWLGRESTGLAVWRAGPARGGGGALQGNWASRRVAGWTCRGPNSQRSGDTPKAGSFLALFARHLAWPSSLARPHEVREVRCRATLSCPCVPEVQSHSLQGRFWRRLLSVALPCDVQAGWDRNPAF